MKELKNSLVVLVALACFVFVAMLYRNHQRFIPATDTVGIALDTHTGTICAENGPVETARCYVVRGACKDLEVDIE
jgi:hypothetical protein